MKKEEFIAGGILLGIFALIALGIFAIKEYKARIPELMVESVVYTKPGDAIVIDDLIQVDVKGDYEIEYEEFWGVPEWGYVDENEVLHIRDNGKSATGNIHLHITATGSFDQSDYGIVSIIIENEINENNSYEVTYSDISLRMYNELEDQGNGVFGDLNHDISIHIADSVDNMAELEEEVKKYAEEIYSVTGSPDDSYRAEDVTLDSGKTVRVIRFSCIENEGEYYAHGTSGGSVIPVVIYAFCEEEHRFFIVDNNSWAPSYEMEQIANTVECD